MGFWFGGRVRGPPSQHGLVVVVFRRRRAVVCRRRVVGLRRPVVLTDGGSEFVGNEWETMLNDWGLRRKRISTHTPTANAVIESSHRSMGQILRTIFDRENPTTLADMDKVVKSALACTIRAVRCAASTSLEGVAPGALVFGRDMLLNIPIVTDIISITDN